MSSERKPSNSYLPTQRMEVIALELEEIDPDTAVKDSDDDDDDDYVKEVDPYAHPSDIKDSCRILIGDGIKVCEIYNPERLKQILDVERIPKRIKVDTLPPGRMIDLPLTGPELGMQPYGEFFNLVVHQETKDDKQLQENMNSYVNLCPAKKGSVRNYSFVKKDFSLDTPLYFEFLDDFFKLTLHCIVFSDSKLVTVTAKWLIGSGIGGDDDDEKIQAATTEETSSYISGHLHFHSTEFDTTSVLLETPGTSTIKVADGQPISLLRNIVAVPYMSDFKVVASLHDRIHGIDVNGETKSFSQSEDNIVHTFTDCILGNGAKIEVEINMKPNDRYWPRFAFMKKKYPR